MLGVAQFKLVLYPIVTVCERAGRQISEVLLELGVLARCCAGQCHALIAQQLHADRSQQEGGGA